MIVLINGSKEEMNGRKLLQLVIELDLTGIFIVRQGVETKRLEGNYMGERIFIYFWFLFQPELLNVNDFVCLC